MRWVEAIGFSSLRFVETAGRMFWFFLEACAWLVRPPFRVQVLVNQFYFIANKSAFIVGLTALFSGMVFAVQFYFGFRLLNADALVGPSAALTLARELAPVFASVVVIARAGAAMAAELGTMRVTEQIDAMDVMAVNSIQYLVSPRILASLVAVPLLSSLFLLVGNAGSYFTGVYLLHIDPAVFYAHLKDFVAMEDLWQGVIKAAVFGVMAATISTFQGYYADGGAEGVGRATNRAVVIAIVLVLVADYFLTLLIRYFLYLEMA